jgi:hypothetical protein
MHERLAHGRIGHIGLPVNQVTTLWINKTGPQGGFSVKRSCALSMSEGLVHLQLHPVAQVTTLGISAN